MDVLFSFVLIGLLILIGFLGNLFFQKTKISDLIILMLIGLLIGPVFHVLPAENIELFKDLTPFFASLALILLLFEGGLYLNFYKVIKELPKSTFFTFFNFILTALFSAVVLHFFGWDFVSGLLMGAILGGTSSAIIIPLVSKSSALEETKTFLSLESAITDALCVVSVIAIIQFIIFQGLSTQEILQSIFAAFSVAALIGIVAALIWLWVLRDFKSTRNYQYLLTVASLFFLYSLTEFVGGNGAFSVLIFGIVLGNSKTIMRFLKIREIELTTEIKAFQTEIAFLIKTFFFVYLGIVFDLAAFNLTTISIAFALMIAMLFPRIISVFLLGKLIPKYKKDSFLIKSMMARGLAAAVLATLPVTMGVESNELIYLIPQIAFLGILLTNLFTTIGFYLNERNKEKPVVIDSNKIEEIKLTKEKKPVEVKKEIQKPKKHLTQEKTDFHLNPE
ncbi:MAG: cation:proton antiporter [Candidatus Diapherotrites archaeon]